jgi:hypothetical protein
MSIGHAPYSIRLYKESISVFWFGNIYEKNSSIGTSIED